MTNLKAIFVSKATLDDVPLITDFVVQLAEYEELRHEVDFKPSQYEDYLFKAPTPPNPEVLLVKGVENDVLGFALFIHILPYVIHLEDLFVRPEARGRGAGVALLSKLAQIALERDVTSLEWACLDWNEPSLKFYKSIGALPVENRVHFRITGEALSRPEKYRHSFLIKENIGIPVLLEACNREGVCLAKMSYTLSFTTFLATPVVLVTAIEWDSADFAPVAALFDHLVQIANDNNFKRVDVRINPTSQNPIAGLLTSEFKAFEMKGWIPLSLSGDALRQLALKNQ